jgi:hypothetical protein
MNLTSKYTTNNDHIYYNNGSKTVCVSTCLNYFGIPSDSYRYTSSEKNVYAYKNVLRRNEYSVCSRKSEFGCTTKRISLTTLKTKLRKSSYGSTDKFIVSVTQRKSAHLIVLDGNGNTIIDTAPNSRWSNVRYISLVKKN